MAIPDPSRSTPTPMPQPERHKRGNWWVSGLVAVCVLAVATFLSLIRSSLDVHGWLSFNPVILLDALKDPPQLSTMIVSYDPLILYMENFLSEKEARHLKTLARDKYIKSTVKDPETGERYTTEERKSSTALLPGSDPVVQAVKARAARLQGMVPTSYIETIQATCYGSGQEYMPHYDAFHDGEPNRATTIFAVLEDSCGRGDAGAAAAASLSCGTQFPRIRINWTAEDPAWCSVVDCAEEVLTIRPRRGNAIFWRNRMDDGKVHPKSLHAGLPLAGGIKIGLNVWTGDVPMAQG